MAKKIPWYVLVDWNSVIGVVGVVLLLATIIVSIELPHIIESMKQKGYHGEATGTISGIAENTTMNQGHQGTRIYVSSYSVSYLFEVGGLIYRGSQIIKATPNATKALDQMTKSHTKEVRIKYVEIDPKESYLVID